jgi:hypothetical protein
MGFHSPFAPLASCPREISIVCIYFIFSSAGQGEKNCQHCYWGGGGKACGFRRFHFVIYSEKLAAGWQSKSGESTGEGERKKLTNDDPSHTTPTNGNKKKLSFFLFIPRWIFIDIIFSLGCPFLLFTFSFN